MRAIPSAVALLLCFAAPLQADVLMLPDEGAAADVAVAKPAKGMTKAAVVERYGQPSLKHKAVGGASKRQPPITRWDYPAFSVFFEYDHVVDAVIPGAPPALRRTEELQQPAG
jgi:hypothetical protein